MSDIISEVISAKGTKAALAKATLMSALTIGATAANAQRPNILYIMSDDHGYQAVSCYRTHLPGLLSLNQTPNIDRIAGGGAIFTNAFCENSICGPSRAALLTGKYSFNHGYCENYVEIDPNQTVFPRLLRDAGYQTAIFGKWHLEYDTKTRNEYVTTCGFDLDRTHTGQGPYFNPTLGGTPYTGYTPDVVTTLAINWLRSGRDTSKPFYISLHHKAVHRTWDPDNTHLHMYDAVTFPYPATFNDNYANRSSAPAEATMRIDPNMNAADFGGTMPATKELKYQAYLRRYLAVVASVDDNVGRLLDFLDSSGLANNTVVIYTSDQGFYLGEHGWFDKRFIYDQSLRMPLLVRYPGVLAPGRVINAFVQNIDFAPTFLNLAGVAVPGEMQGKSILPLLGGTVPPTWRTSVYYHYYEWPTDHAVRQHYGLRNNRYKLVYYYAIDEWELFDLQNDPNEISSLAGNPSYSALMDTLKRDLVTLRIESKEAQPVPVPARLQAELYYNLRSSNMRTANCTDAGAGRCFQSIQAGNWLEYLIDVPANGQYRCYYRVAANAANGRIAFQAEKINFSVQALLAAPSYTAMDTTAIRNNGSLTSWHTDSTDLLSLQQGVYHVRLYMLAGGYNINWVEFGSNQSTRVSDNRIDRTDPNRFDLWISGDNLCISTPPNPSFKVLPARIALFTMHGTLVWKESVQLSGTGTHTIRIGGSRMKERPVPSGVYVLQVSLNSAGRTLLCNMVNGRE